MKTKTIGEFFELCPTTTAASEKLGIVVLNEQRLLSEWRTSVLMTICKEKGDVRNHYAHRRAKLLEHAMKIFKRVVEKMSIRMLEDRDAKQFVFFRAEKQQTQCL